MIFLTVGVGCSGNQRITLFDAGGGDGDDAGSDGGAGDAGGGDGGTCPAGIRYCEGLDFYECGDDGSTRTLIASCEDRCESPLGCVVCSPGTGRCDGEVSMRCSADGQRYDRLRDCEAAGNRCGPSGFCEDACGEIEETESNVGCRFTAIPLLTHGQVSLGSFRVVIGNTSPDETAHVTIRRGGETVAERDVAPGSAESIDLPWIETMSFRFGTGYSPDAISLWESFVTEDGAYEIRSDLPVTAYQLSPGNSDAVPSNGEGSLLLPHHVLTGDFPVFGWPPLVSSDRVSLPPYVAMTPAGERPVTVRVAGSVDVLGADGRWEDTPKGTPLEISLRAGEVAHLLPTDPRECLPRSPGAVRNGTKYWCPFNDNDLTGTVLSADGPLVAFSGHMGALVPFWVQALDHLEEQVPPAHTWGTSYVVTPMGDFDAIGHRETNVVRILGSGGEAMSITLRPAISGMLEAEVPAEGFLELAVDRSVSLRSENPFLVAQYMVGADFSEDTAFGDPSVFLPPPVDQYKNAYTFAVDGEFQGFGGGWYAVFVRPEGDEIVLDGAVLDGPWRPAGAGEYEWLPHAVDPGSHLASSEARFGLVVSGVGSSGGYAYSAGSDLRDIVTLR